MAYVESFYIYNYYYIYVYMCVNLFKMINNIKVKYFIINNPRGLRTST